MEIRQSLDAEHGLDESALCAAAQWRFRPATRDGLPIATVVTIVMSFTMR